MYKKVNQNWLRICVATFILWSILAKGIVSHEAHQFIGRTMLALGVILFVVDLCERKLDENNA